MSPAKTAKEVWLAKQLNLSGGLEESLVASQRHTLVGQAGPEQQLDEFAESDECAASDFSAEASDSFLTDSDSQVGGEVFESSSDDAGEQPAKRTRYAKRRPQSEQLTFLGAKVCRRAFCRLLQIGGSTIQKIRNGQSAFTNRARPPSAKHPTFNFTLRGEAGSKWEQIIMYLWYIYQSSAEIMPTNWKMLGSPMPSEEPFQKQSEDPQDDRDRLINSIGKTLNTRTTDLEVNLIGPGTFMGPRRSLMHGSRTELYWEYRVYAESRSLSPASYQTFMRVANCVLKPGLRNGHLRFRKKNEHGQCDVCFRLREAVRKAKGEKDKIDAQKELHRHYLSQWLDRQVYWSYRSMSQTWFSNVLSENIRPA